jgi:hypothetical protein
MTSARTYRSRREHSGLSSCRTRGAPMYPRHSTSSDLRTSASGGVDDAMESFLAAWTCAFLPRTASRLPSLRHAAALADLTGSAVSRTRYPPDVSREQRGPDARIRQFLWMRIAEQELTSGNVTCRGESRWILWICCMPSHPYAGRVA